MSFKWLKPYLPRGIYGRAITPDDLKKEGVE